MAVQLHDEALKDHSAVALTDHRAVRSGKESLCLEDEQSTHEGDCRDILAWYMSAE